MAGRPRPSHISSLSSPLPTLCSYTCPRSHLQLHARQFSQSCRRDATLLRRQMYAWLNAAGHKFRNPLPGSTNYLGAYDKFGNLVRAQSEEQPEGAKEGENPDEQGGPKSEENMPQQVGDKKLPPESQEDLRPFPVNPHFRSLPVLDEEMRELIYEIVEDSTLPVPREKRLEIASVQYGVSVERVGAVVRLKALEKSWEKEGKFLAKPYAKAVLAMLPTTKKAPKDHRQRDHESYNDIPIHAATKAQIFVPTSESRRFTRVDAAKAFDKDLLPADDRIPHPGLVTLERGRLEGLDTNALMARQAEFNAKLEKKKQAIKDRKQKLSPPTVAVPGRRWDFRFQDVSVERVGSDGRDPRGVGWRYGMPLEDRKRGHVKIPTKVVS
ncbi:hypothetical protein K490DRAFT_73901 [Saccharata proteae CBS 121410]|uniref:Ribosomal protein S35, mitochondrial n=1 Tax=Saccharata proteae CBS 121410 TaxID=1314787 RepID=A0A9P4HWA9_9PEZI|nr:hypothetical protein K490DRAFT_73901 [Saccharata proteae CBS 121410]